MWPIQDPSIERSIQIVFHSTRWCLKQTSIFCWTSMPYWFGIQGWGLGIRSTTTAVAAWFESFFQPCSTPVDSKIASPAWRWMDRIPDPSSRISIRVPSTRYATPGRCWCSCQATEPPGLIVIRLLLRICVFIVVNSLERSTLPSGITLIFRVMEGAPAGGVRRSLSGVTVCDRWFSCASVAPLGRSRPIIAISNRRGVCMAALGLAVFVSTSERWMPEWFNSIHQQA